MPGSPEPGTDPLRTVRIRRGSSRANRPRLRTLATLETESLKSQVERPIPLHMFSEGPSGSPEDAARGSHRVWARIADATAAGEEC